MGAFGSILSSKAAVEVFIDFEDAMPTPAEEEMHNIMAELLVEGQGLVKDITDYAGCGQLIRADMMNRSPDAKETCFEALLEHVGRINHFYEYSQKLEENFPTLLTTVCDYKDDIKEMIAQRQALAKQVAEVLEFTLRFDQERMMTSAVSNDFSYYRRILSKFSNHPDIVVGDDEASTMAMFTADPQPMLVSITKATTTACSQDEYVMPGLAVMANSCKWMIESKRFRSPATNLFAARAMTGAIVLYDRVDAASGGTGVFHKKSPVQVKQCIQCLKRLFPEEVSLLSAIQYSTSTFRDAPSGVQALFS